MKQVIKYAALLFALVLAASIIGGCLTLGISLVQGLYEEFSYPEDLEGQDNSLWYRTEEGDVVFMGIHLGGNGEVKSGSETYTAAEIQALDLEGISGSLQVETWENDFISVEYENIPEEYKIYNDNGTLTIEKDGGIFFWGISFTEIPKLRVYVPADQVFENVNIDKDSGSAVISGIKSEELQIDSGSGAISAKHVTAQKTVLNSGSGAVTVQNSSTGETSLDSGSGFVNFENVTAKNLVVDSGSGRVDYSGFLTGNSVIDTGSGSINMEIYGEEEDYNIRADLGSGGMYINGSKVKDTDIKYSGASNLLVFDTGSGRVSVEFKEVQGIMQEDTSGEATNQSGENYDR